MDYRILLHLLLLLLYYYCIRTFPAIVVINLEKLETQEMQQHYHGIGSLANYSNFEQVGEGTYGYVFRALEKGKREVVALKKMIIHRESLGFPLAALREINFLKSLQHPSIVKLRTIVSSIGCEEYENEIHIEKLSSKKIEPTSDVPTSLSRCGNLYLVFDYIEHDLCGLLDSEYKFTMGQIKFITKQLFEVMDFIHDKKIIHRDIKTSNVLLSNRFQIKLADFGLARKIDTARPVDLSVNVVTLWYRAPEILLGSRRYCSSVDMWSVGCVIGEMHLGKPLFHGSSEIDQISNLLSSVGSIDEAQWPGVSALPKFNMVTQCENPFAICGSLRNYYSGRIHDPMLNLLEKLIVLDPDKRLTASQASGHSFLHNCPLLSELGVIDIPSGKSCHEYQAKMKRKHEYEDMKKKKSLTKENVTAERIEEQKDDDNGEENSFKRCFGGEMSPSL